MRKRYRALTDGELCFIRFEFVASSAGAKKEKYFLAFCSTLIYKTPSVLA
jgi:hypothetical protein